MTRNGVESTCCFFELGLLWDVAGEDKSSAMKACDFTLWLLVLYIKLR